jgi:uncharacterized protein (TIGR03067 family)
MKVLQAANYSNVEIPMKVPWVLVALVPSLFVFEGCSDAASPPIAGPAGTKAADSLRVDEADSNSPPYEGHWTANSATLAGKALPRVITDSIELAVTGVQYEVNVGGRTDKGTCTVDRETSPNRMTITGTDGPNAGKKILTIFDFPEATQMRVCYDLTGTAYPDRFESTAENGLFLVIYERAKYSTAQDRPGTLCRPCCES